MKSIKKILTLTLTVVMLTSMLVLPVMAEGAEEDGLQPRYPVMECPVCESAIRVSEHEEVLITVTSCAMDSSAHTHENHYNVLDGLCRCGYLWESWQLMYSVCIGGVAK